MTNRYEVPSEMTLGVTLNTRVPNADQIRQREEVNEILARLHSQPGVVLADEVGTGKTFVALAVAYSMACKDLQKPVVVMVPPNLVEKWVQDLMTFVALYLEGRHLSEFGSETIPDSRGTQPLVYGVARHAVDFFKLLDGQRNKRCRLIFLTQGAMDRRMSDKWLRLALIQHALKRHARGGAKRLITVRNQIHRFMAPLMHAVGEQNASIDGEELWQKLIAASPSDWKDLYNASVGDPKRQLKAPPVPKAVLQALPKLNLKLLASALTEMPLRASGGDDRTNERIARVRSVVKDLEGELWKLLLVRAKWRSPLLILDEAHHLKNPETKLAKSMQHADAGNASHTGAGALSQSFDRMLFLTATPFELGHHELINVLRRFGDVRWREAELGNRDAFLEKLRTLGERLTESQRAAISFQRAWSRLDAAEVGEDVEWWWKRARSAESDALALRERAARSTFEAAESAKVSSETLLRPWIIRNNKPTLWTGTSVRRRRRSAGAEIQGAMLRPGGLPIPNDQLLPFFLAARSAVNPRQDLLGEALSSSYEAFRYTRKSGNAARDETDEDVAPTIDLDLGQWYLREFDRALKNQAGSLHPKIRATAKLAVDLWEDGEKVLVFAFYLRTCSALRIHISNELERRIDLIALTRLTGQSNTSHTIDLDKLIESVGARFFDKPNAVGRRALDAALNEILESRASEMAKANLDESEGKDILDVMRRFLRVRTTLLRYFPLTDWRKRPAAECVQEMLDFKDRSGISWREKFVAFIDFLCAQSTQGERMLYLQAALAIQAGKILAKADDSGSQAPESQRGSTREKTLANIQIASGETQRDARTRLMRAFNTPFFPDILVCSEVMGEGVDLHRHCSHVIHHDLSWSPSTIEQRTGRVDRIGCKADGRQSIEMYLPYLAGAADERQFRVMSDRERWFRVVMGQEEVAQLVPVGAEGLVPLPEGVAVELSFNLATSGSIQS